MMRKIVLAVAVALALIAALAYLRDPPWIATLESGFRGWETAPDGLRYRWTSGHASFFVPAAAKAIVIPARTTFAPNDPPVLLSISIDDYVVVRDLLTDSGWTTRQIAMPAPGPRSTRRIDILVDRVRPGNRGLQVGEISVVR